jgi:neutral ceramidase
MKKLNVCPKFLESLMVIMLFCNIICAQKADVKNPGNFSGFRAAVVKIDITPDNPQRLRGYQERISTGVHDHIYYRIVALDDGTTQFFLLSIDASSLSPAQYDHVASQLNHRLGINPVNFWWSLTHTHSAPEIGDPGIVRMFMPNRFEKKLDTTYVNLVEQKLIEGIIEARFKLLPARLGVGWGFSQANINRRAIDIDGKASLGMNPDGAVDRRIGLLRIDKEDGSPLVLIANYPIHGTVLGGENLEISGDVQGIG